MGSAPCIQIAPSTLVLDKTFIFLVQSSGKEKNKNSVVVVVVVPSWLKP